MTSLLALLRRPGRLSFVTQFALVSGLLLALAGVGLAQVLGGRMEERALDNAANTGAIITSLGIAPRLGVGDFDGEPLSDREVQSLRGIVGTVGGGVSADGLRHRLLRVNVFSADGTVVYSDDPTLIGRSFDTDHLRRAGAGQTVSDVTELRTASGESPEGTVATRALEVYVPLTFGLDQPVGIVESYLPYEPVAAAISRDKLVLYAALGLTLLTFWLVMFRMVLRASRRLQRSADRNEFLAHHDVLTGLPNRALLLERLEDAVDDAEGHGGQVGVLLIDLDRFKEVNDTLGHETGDLLLKEVSCRISRELRHIDTVARLGGDEFVVLLPQIDGVPGATAAAERVLEALHQPFIIRGVDLAVEASVGVACYPDHGADHGALLQHADVAMYVAKQARGTYATYDRTSDASSISRITLLNELRRALEEDELVLYYQPKEELKDGSVNSVEALIRWEHPERGIVPPGEFLPVAEQTGLITALTTRVLSAAFRQLKEWHAHGRQLSVSVNLSARNLADLTLPDTVERLAREAGVEPGWLEVEVTETSAMTDPLRASEILRRLAELGVSVSVDDYGTGYSSLSYLRSLPIDTLKIDRSFVTAMLEDEGNAVIVRSTVELAHNLGLRVVAEGVEDLPTREALAMLGCNAVQGYYLSRPLPARELDVLLDQRAVDRREGVPVT